MTGEGSLYELLPEGVRFALPSIYDSDERLWPEEYARWVCDFVDRGLAAGKGPGDEPPGESWLGEMQRTIAAQLASNQATLYDLVNLAREYSPEYLEAAERAQRVGSDGGVHLELGTWKSFPSERIQAIAERDGLAEFVRLDMDQQYLPDVVADCADLPFVESSIDRISSNSLLEHVAYPHAVIAESFRVLRAGGAMTITVPFHFVLHGCPQDYLRYTPAFFDKVCREVGFAEVVCETHAFGGVYYTLHQACKAAMVRDDLPRDQARSLQSLHASVMLLLAALTPLDAMFVGEGRQLFHSVSCLAFKAGAHEPRGRDRKWDAPFVERALDLLACPACKSSVLEDGGGLVCPQCNVRYPIREGIPLFVEPQSAGGEGAAKAGRVVGGDCG